MIKEYVLSIVPQDPGEKIHFNMGSVLHGFLMESLPAPLVEYLHGIEVRPYSQYVFRENGVGYWRILALNQEMIEEIEALLNTWQQEPVFLKQRQKFYTLALVQSSKERSYREFSRAFFLEQDPCRRVKVQFCTPSSFRVDSEYQMFPSIKLILASSCRKWNALSDDVVFDDEESLEMIGKDVSIQRYDLKSARFSLERIKIPSFVGEMELSIRGPEMTVRWINLLLAYAAFSGTGIKTALGMGGIRTSKWMGNEYSTAVSLLSQEDCI